MTTSPPLRFPLFSSRVSRLAAPLLWAAAFAALLASCSTLPENISPERGDVTIMGSETVPLDRFLQVAETRNPDLGQSRWTEVWTAYRDACDSEGVRQSVALSQMILETNAMKFGGTVRAYQNNFAGLGVTGGGVVGLSFPNIETGALAHVQHLKAYGSTDSASRPLVDPRFRYVKRGSAATLRGLTHKWAADPRYGEKLITLREQLLGIN